MHAADTCLHLDAAEDIVCDRKEECSAESMQPSNGLSVGVANPAPAFLTRHPYQKNSRTFLNDKAAIST
jgi:hypothetical protein